METRERIDLLFSHALICVCAGVFAGEVEQARAAAAFDVPPDEFESLLRVVVDAAGEYLAAAERGPDELWRLAGGGYADWCVAPAGQCLPVPAGRSLIEAAAIPETFFTVWTNVFERGRLGAGEWLFLHGGTSGIGTTAIQLAAARGATVVATAGTEEKCRAITRLGAAHAINYSAEVFVASVKALTSGRGVDVVLDIIGGEYTRRNIDCLARDGRLVQIGVMGGAETSLSLRPLLLKRLSITGSTLRIRTPKEKGAIAAALEREVWPLLESGAVAPIVDAVVPLEQAARAHELLESGDVIGKVVLTVS